MRALIWTVTGFLCSSLMFSYWIGLLLRINIRGVGDGNPGASNLWKEAGFQFGLLGIALDFLKGYLPLALIVNTGILVGCELVPVALAAIAGHAFSPFLKFRGGKSLAVTFGVWSALTQFRASIAYAIILASLYIIAASWRKGRRATSNEDGIQTTLGFLFLGIYLLVNNYPNAYAWIWLGNFCILCWKNRVAFIKLVQYRA